MDGYSEDYNPRFTLWNAQMSWNVGKTNAGQIRFRIVDILNNNNNTQRNVRETYIEDVTYNRLQRYFLVAFTYNLNSALRLDAPQQDGVRGAGQRQFQMPPGIAPPGGGRPGQQVIIVP